MRAGARESGPKREKAGLWGPKGAKRSPNGAQTEAKWSQNVPKIEVSTKSAESGLDPLFTIYTHYRHPAKTSLFDTSKQPKCRSFSRVASDAAPGLQNGAHGAVKWREWGPPGSPRLPKGLPMPPKMLQKTIQTQHSCSEGASGTPPPPKYLHF